MAASVLTAAYVQGFERIVRHLAQQGISRVRPFVTERASNAEKHNWERLASIAAVQKTSARAATPEADGVWSRRVSIAQTWHAGDSFEHEDVAQVLVDPNSAIANNIAMAMKRAVDDEIIAAATGAAMQGTGSTVAFPAGQLLSYPTVPFSFDMVTEVTEKFLKNNIDPSEPKVFVIGPTQMRKLLQLSEATSDDYVNAKVLSQKGYVESWMGYTWVVSTRLLKPVTTDISCLAFTKRAIGLHVAKDIWTRIAERPDISFAWQVYAAYTMGAVRTEDEHIVHVNCLDSL